MKKILRLIHEHHKRFAAAYGKWDISINYHMALHICDIISDYGPPHGYWCYAYERMNGYLSEIPNNGRNIESQIMVKLLQQLCFSSCELPNISAKTSTALKPILATDVEMDADNYAVYQYKLYTSPVLDRFEYQCSIDRGEVDHWPIEFLHPSKSRVKVDKEVYKSIEDFCKKVYNTDGNVYANPMIDKFGRCAVNGQTYSSDFNSTDRGSVVKALFVLKDSNELQPYFGIIRFFFKLCVTLTYDTSNGKKNEVFENSLAYVTWMCFKTPQIDKTTGLYMVNDAFYEQDRVMSPRRFLNRCALAPTGRKGAASYYVTELPR